MRSVQCGSRGGVLSGRVVRAWMKPPLGGRGSIASGMQKPDSNPAPRAAVLTVSDRCHVGLTPDLSGPAACRRLEALGWVIAPVAILPDEPEELASWMRERADLDQVDLILTLGGTGLGPRDRTPEATLAVIDRSAPGLAEWMRSRGAEQTPLAALSRGVAGLRSRTLILNLPGSPRAVEESLDSIQGLLPHLVSQLRGRGDWGAHSSHRP